ncbi:MAG TPA: response regulator, partial [Amaricoccus sp.]|uniref:response regulator n=2 Tax=Amaricoccus TaxID=56999 RepID=UPI002D1795C3
LPRAPAGGGAPGATALDSGPIRAVRSERVLLVEDDTDVLRTLWRQLEHLGYRVVPATAAEEAMRIIRKDAAIDLLVTDIGLAGGRSGLELVRDAIRHRPALGLLLLTGNTAAAPEGEVEGVPVLAKPADLGTLSRALRAALQARAAASGANT